MITLLVALVFVALLWLEWRYQLRSVRLATVLLALIVLYFSQPLTHRAARRAITLPPSARVSTSASGERTLTEYESGVVTMEQAVLADADIGAEARRISLGVLVWLAIAPAFRESRAKAMNRDRDTQAA